MTGGDIIALVGVLLVVAVPLYASVWYRLGKIEDKLSERVGALHAKIDKLALDTAEDHKQVLERLARLEALQEVRQ